ncbi:Sec23/Sec24 trunk domain-containing protein [Cunninghamella echinulata]|nr:Sec23/Sec24 trunk domain-containing protein [Cunninghamella echinulata]
MKDQEYYLQNEFSTCSKDAPPLACTDFKVVDQGNSNPRFIRSTLREIPQNSQLLEDAHIPFGVIVQPLAKLHAHDDPVLLASTSEDGPIRCSRCKGYINPWCNFIDGGRKFICNLCGFDNDVPSDYFGPLDMSGKRMDTDQRPELRVGTVEFPVPSLYWTRQPTPLHIMFAIDVSWSAIQSGMLSTFCEALKKTLYQAKSLDSNVKIAIVTYDTTIHFYNLKATLEQASMMVVSDIEEMFLPLSDGLFVDPQESKLVIEDLLDNLPLLFSKNKTSTSVFIPVVKGALMALKPNGGKLHIFHTSLPTSGPGALKNRDDVKLYGTDKEKQLFIPQNGDYHTLGIECVNEGVCIDLWLFPLQAYIDVCTLGVLSSLTGGDTHYFPDFNDRQYGGTFTFDLQHSLQREQGYNGALRLRCSNGLKIDDQYGNFYMTNSTDIELGGIDSDKSIAFSVGLDGKLPENKEAYLQCALLYTTQGGERRVRVHNLALSVSTSVSVIFKNSDFDTTINFIAKKAITNSITRGTETISNDLDKECIKILTAYRKHCASSAAPGQLILPESFKMLPLITLALKKSQVLRKDLSLTPDNRVYNMRRMKCMSIAGTMKWFYPTMVQLDLLFIMNPEQPLVWPLERLSYQRLKNNSIYFIDADDKRFIWIGSNTQASHLQGLFGVDRLDQINPQLEKLQYLDNDISARYNQLVDSLDNNRSSGAKLTIIRQGLDIENEFVKLLVEDETFNQMCYVDYLCLIHKRIQSELEREKHENFVSSTNYWAYRY